MASWGSWNRSTARPWPLGCSRSAAEPYLVPLILIGPPAPPRRGAGLCRGCVGRARVDQVITPAFGFLDRNLHLDVPSLTERHHREEDQEHLDRNQQHCDQPEKIRRQASRGEA